MRAKTCYDQGMREYGLAYMHMKQKDIPFTEHGIQSFFSRTVLRKAKVLLRNSLPQFEGFVTRDHIVEIKAVKIMGMSNYQFYSYFDPHEETVAFQLDQKANVLRQYTCSCWEFYREGYCEHLAAAMLGFLQKYNAEGNFSFLKEPESSYPIQNFFQHTMPYKEQRAVLPEAPVYLQPCIHEVVPFSGSLSISFRIGYRHARMYIVKNIMTLIHAVRQQECIQYGRFLNFTHTVDAFDMPSRNLLQFLRDRIDLETAGDHRESYYAGRTERTLILRGIELDQFIRLVRPDALFYMSNTVRQPVQLSINEEPFSLDLYLERADHGFLLKGKAPPIAVGAAFLYILDGPGQTMHMVERKDTSFEHLAASLYQNSQEPIYISSQDVPGFSRLLLPLVRQQMVTLQGSDFELTKYIPKAPDFEIQLDLPQPDLLTCHAWSIYADGRRYIIFQQNNDADSRDLASERAMDTWLSSWFTAFNPAQNSLSIYHDDSKLYRLITEGIGEMQLRAKVYISEKLKPMANTRTFGMHVGVRLSHDRLLELDIAPENYSLEELAEIMSRYSPKKKFYRLKSGEFITVDDSLNAFASLKETLSLSGKDLLKGVLQVPVYRAMYLAKEAAEGIAGIHLQNDVQQLIARMKDTEHINYEIPELNVSLRPYQVEGYRWLCALRDNGFAGLLADEMGLGKTLQVLALLKAWEKRKRVLIICPASLVYNWGEEIERFAPKLSYSLVSGSAARRAEIIRAASDHHILITSYDALKRDFIFYEKMNISCEIIDEAQYIKNADTQTAQAVKSINAQFRVALTGTPIENHLSELWSIFDYLLPGYLFTYSSFRKRFEMPIVHDQDDVLERRLKEMIQPFILRRLKQDVLHDLPAKLEEVSYAPLADEQKELYDARVQRLKILLAKQSDEEFKENKILVLSELTKLRELCCDPRLLYENYTGNSAKLEMCIELLHVAIDSGHKVLLFSQFTSMLAIITRQLQERGISYFLLQGSTLQTERAKSVRQFQTDDTSVFCISLKAGGTGLNLTAADIVIHYDPWWNTAVENQASDRAHRIGQKNIVNIYKLIVKGTIEEKILAMQREKSDLAAHILSGEGFSSARLSRQDLLNLL